MGRDALFVRPDNARHVQYERKRHDRHHRLADQDGSERGIYSASDQQVRSFRTCGGERYCFKAKPIREHLFFVGSVQFKDQQMHRLYREFEPFHASSSGKLSLYRSVGDREHGFYRRLRELHLFTRFMRVTELERYSRPAKRLCLPRLSRK